MQNFKMKVAVTWINGDIEHYETMRATFPDELDLVEHLHESCMKVLEYVEACMEGSGGFLKILKSKGCPVHLRVDQMRSCSIRFYVNGKILDFDTEAS